MSIRPHEMIISREKPKYLEQNLPHYHFVYDKSHMDSLGIDPGPPQ
jgi:hypothetical protein